ncbi:CRISPR-associated protein [Stieleria neptunia]|uniref:CRISPR-associated protein n=1 Tax=Stieleria neptunia TaxID=2527979 RepID=A0A518HSA2_9BACT|nr:type I-C CRISPR-associated protein Cas8c/Csd1 [Stieleria neptunia]QDV43719.1 CRISPR-associated protein [Stieleria neptunia]
MNTKHVGLNEFHSSSAYHAGRLMALFQQIQDLDSPDLNSTFSSRYFSAATDCPARVLPTVCDIAMKRLRRLPVRKHRYDLRAALIRTYGQIDRLPSVLTLKGKAEFQLGYFHQCGVVVGRYKNGRYKSSDGTIVKSLGERTIADLLFQNGVKYCYEEPLNVPIKLSDPDGEKKQVEPDFTIERFGFRLLIEYTGLLDDVRYHKNWRWKLKRLTRGLGGKEFRDLVAATGDTYPVSLTKFTLLDVTPDELQSQVQVDQLLEKIQTWISWIDSKNPQ